MTKHDLPVLERKEEKSSVSDGSYVDFYMCCGHTDPVLPKLAGDHIINIVKSPKENRPYQSNHLVIMHLFINYKCSISTSIRRMLRDAWA